MPPFAVISYALWLNRFHRDAHVAGATITLDRRNYNSRPCQCADVKDTSQEAGLLGPESKTSLPTSAQSLIELNQRDEFVALRLRQC